MLLHDVTDDFGRKLIFEILVQLVCPASEGRSTWSNGASIFCRG